MEQEIRTIEAGRKFILLLLCYYAIPVIQSALAVVNGIPGVSYHWQRILNANADVIKVVFCLCTVLVLIMLIMIKEYNIDKRYKSGLLLMMANPIWATLKAFSPDTLLTTKNILPYCYSENSKKCSVLPLLINILYFHTFSESLYSLLFITRLIRLF